MRFRLLMTLVVVSVIQITPARSIEIAGDLLVDVDAATYELGSATWTNAGSYTDFDAVGNPGLLTIGNAPAVTFDGASAFVGSDVAPEEVIGFEDRSIEAWVFNPTIDPEETVVSWGKRGGPEGSGAVENGGAPTEFSSSKNLLWKIKHLGGGG